MCLFNVTESRLLYLLWFCKVYYCYPKWQQSHYCYICFVIFRSYAIIITVLCERWSWFGLGLYSQETCNHQRKEKGKEKLRCISDKNSWGTEKTSTNMTKNKETPEKIDPGVSWLNWMGPYNYKIFCCCKKIQIPCHVFPYCHRIADGCQCD